MSEHQPRIALHIKVGEISRTPRSPYDRLAPHQMEAVAHGLAYLGLESTPERRDALAKLIHNGVWEDALEQLREALTQNAVELRG